MKVGNNEYHLELTALANKLFMYTDAQQWQELLDEVFTEEVWMDLSSAGGGNPRFMKAESICEMWKQGFGGLDAVHHQAGHYLSDIKEEEALIYAYAVAFHYKKSASKGPTRTFVGSYDLKALNKGKGWRLSSFKYNLKFVDGNSTLE